MIEVRTTNTLCSVQPNSNLNRGDPNAGICVLNVCCKGEGREKSSVFNTRTERLTRTLFLPSFVPCPNLAGLAAASPRLRIGPFPTIAPLSANGSRLPTAQPFRSAMAACSCLQYSPFAQPELVVSYWHHAIDCMWCIGLWTSG